MKYLLETMLERKEVAAADVLSRVNFIISGLLFFLLSRSDNRPSRKNVLVIIEIFLWDSDGGVCHAVGYAGEGGRVFMSGDFVIKLDFIFQID